MTEHAIMRRAVFQEDEGRDQYYGKVVSKAAFEAFVKEECKDGYWQPSNFYALPPFN